MPTRRNNFPKSQRLCRLKPINHLFTSESRTLTAYPLRVIYQTLPSTPLPPRVGGRGGSLGLPPTQVLFSVSKRKFKHAVNRNRAKRQMRESWRLNRNILLQSTPLPTWEEHGGEILHCAFIWLSSDPQPTDLVQRKMRSLLHRLSEALPSAQ